MTSFRLDGQVAVVNGGSRGIGRAIALGLAEAGANVTVSARSQVDLDGVAASIRAIGTEALVVPADMRLLPQVERMIEETVDRFGRIDILVNAAGMALRQPAVEITADDFEQVYATNIRGLTFACTIAGRHFLAQGSGRIINIASLASVLGVPSRALYGSTKGAVAQLTMALAVEWGPHNVCVNAILPGWIATDFTRAIFEQPEVLKRVTDRTPLGRLGSAEDVAALAVFLASPASSFMTGQLIRVDGGYGST